MYRAHQALAALSVAALLSACAYRPYAGAFEPFDEDQQLVAGMAVADDGSVTFAQGRLEIRLRPLTDEELNRQFAAYSQRGPRSVNPYTFGNSEMFSTGETPRRFTVFRLTVKNYEYPKVRVRGEMSIASDNGRWYYALTLSQLDTYYRAYVMGYRGNEYGEYKERRAILQRTIYPDKEIFSGQEAEGYVVFPALADDVSAITVSVPDIVIRYDYRGDPVESIAAAYRFRRDIGRRYPDGRVEWIGAG